MTISNSASPRQTIEQRRSLHAWKRITSMARLEHGQRKYPDDAKEYADEAKRLPTRILTAGLGASLAFVLARAQAKSDKPKRHLVRLIDDLTHWLRERPIPMTHPESLTESIMHGSADFLRRATDETLAYLTWLNRFADAEGLRKD